MFAMMGLISFVQVNFLILFGMDDLISFVQVDILICLKPFGRF